jgi:hypothetical protein
MLIAKYWKETSRRNKSGRPFPFQYARLANAAGAGVPPAPSGSVARAPRPRTLSLLANAQVFLYAMAIGNSSLIIVSPWTIGAGLAPVNFVIPQRRSREESASRW